MDGHGFLYSAFVFLAAAVLVVPIAKRVGLGSVLGYLLAGVVIGPFGLRLLTDDGTIMHFAEFGVVMMLFLIGLELQPRMLWALRRPILGTGGAQVAVTALAIAGIAIGLGQPWQVGLAVGMALALSSTAIVLQTMSERGMMKTATGERSFSVLLFQDIAVIPILAVLPLLSIAAPEVAGDAAGGHGHGGGGGWLDTVKVVGAVGGIVLGGRFLMRPLFRAIAGSGVRELFTATSLLLVIGIALLMQSIGLSPALGTFMAGVVLADSEYRHALETDIEPFKGLLLGLFFISVGMSVDFDLLAAQPVTVGGLTGGLIVLKVGLLLALGRFAGMSNPQTLLFAFLLGQGGEFGFVLFQFAVTEGAIPPDLGALLTLVVALSMVSTPLMLLLHDHVLARRFAGPQQEREADTLDLSEHEVIIAGYGRFGQIVGRTLGAMGVKTVLIDHNAEHVDFVRRFGQVVFYGDATRLDLLEAAGAEHAKMLVLAIDDRERAVETARLVKQHFPHLKVLARAYDRRHAYQLMDAGVDVLRRETFLSALRLARDALEVMGVGPFQAKRVADRFARLDRRNLLHAHGFHKDEEALISHSRQARQDMEEAFQEDRAAGFARVDEGWEDRASAVAEEADARESERAPGQPGRDQS